MTKRSMRAFRTLILSGTALSVLSTAGMASAQTAAGANEGAIDQIVVTARKREEQVKDVPGSVTVMSGRGLEAASSGGLDISFLSARVPSLVVESSFGRTFPRFYVRGLGNTDFDLNASQPVSLVYDDVVYENPILKGFPVFDVKGIEVLRGPQGTLFGRNTPAGVVKFDSVRPSETFGGYAKLGLRSFNGTDFEAAIGGPLAPGWSARASVLSQTQGDWVTNAKLGGGKTLGDYRDQAGRVQLRYEDSTLDANLNLHGRKLRGTSQLFRANIIKPGTNGFVAGFDPEKVYYDGGAGNNQTLETYGATANVTYDLGGLTLTSVTGYEHAKFYGRGDIDGGFGASYAPPYGPGFIPFSSETADAVDGLSQFSQEIRLSNSAKDKLYWQVGAYSFNETVKISSYSFDSLFGAGQNGYANQKQDTTAWALFGSATYKPSDKLTLTGGLRYSDDSKDFSGYRKTSPVGGGALPTVKKSVGDSAVSWDVSAVYEVTPDTNVYGRIARGFRAPSLQGRLLFGDVVTTARSEFVTSYEAGVKSTLLDRKLRLDASSFYYEIKNQQLTAIGGAGNFNQLLNAKKGEGYGFEIESELRPIERLALTAAVSYNHTEIKDANLTVGPCGSGCTVTDPVVGGAAKINGNSFPNAPEWIIDLTARYSYPLASGGEVFVYTDWAYKGQTNFFLYTSKEYVVDGYWEGGVRTGYVTADGKTEFTVYGRNITDEVRLVGGVDFNNLTGFINPPRVWGAEIKLRY
jgi:iron complex outermembrane receptor protein